MTEEVGVGSDLINERWDWYLPFAKRNLKVSNGNLNNENSSSRWLVWVAEWVKQCSAGEVVKLLPCLTELICLFSETCLREFQTIHFQGMLTNPPLPSFPCKFPREASPTRWDKFNLKVTLVMSVTENSISLYYGLSFPPGNVVLQSHLCFHPDAQTTETGIYLFQDIKKSRITARDLFGST